VIKTFLKNRFDETLLIIFLMGILIVKTSLSPEEEQEYSYSGAECLDFC